MLHLVKTERVYRPKIVAVMTVAFDHACASIPNLARRDEVRRQLATIILRHVDSGVEEPERLVDLALREFAAPAAPHRGRSATG